MSIVPPATVTVAVAGGLGIEAFAGAWACRGIQATAITAAESIAQTAREEVKRSCSKAGFMESLTSSIDLKYGLRLLRVQAQFLLLDRDDARSSPRRCQAGTSGSAALHARLNQRARSSAG